MNDQSRTELIESKIDLAKAGAMSLTSMGVAFHDMGEVMQFAKLMAVSGPAVREVFRGNPGACLAVTLQALSLGFEPFAFARKCYMVNGEIAYEAQLINGIILGKAPFVKRPDVEFSGEGPSRRCKVTFHFRDGDDKTYESPPLAGITPKNSPLWKSDPDQQLSYYSTRAAARRYCPDVILGMYDPEEMASALAKDVTPPKAPIAESLAKGEKPKVVYVDANGVPSTPNIQWQSPKVVEATYVDAGPALERDIGPYQLHGQSGTMPVEGPAEAKDDPPASEPRTPSTEAAPPVPEPPQGSQSTDNQQGGEANTSLGTRTTITKQPHPLGGGAPTQETSDDGEEGIQAQAKPEGQAPAGVTGGAAEEDRRTLTLEENGKLADLAFELAGVATASDLHTIQELWSKTVADGSPAFKLAVAEKYKTKVEKLGKGKKR